MFFCNYEHLYMQLLLLQQMWLMTNITMTNHVIYMFYT